MLGPLEVHADGAPVPLGGPRQRALLAYLLVNANRVVAADTLVEELWSSQPRDGTAALQNQVSRLRKVLGDRLVTKSPGYLLRVEPGEVDLDRFRALVASAGSASDPGERSRLLREADAIFRGPPFEEVDASFAAAESAALEELRLAAVEARIDADLERCRHAELVPELGALIAHHPLRERLRRQLILALYRSDRQADALDAYRETHRMLDEQLGLEPSPALRELERAILRHDPALAVEEVAVAAAAPQAPRRRRRMLVAGVAVAALTVAAVAVGGVTTFDRPSRQRAAPPAVTPPAVVRHPHVQPKAVVAVRRPRAVPKKAPVHQQRPQQVVVTVIESATPPPAATTTVAAQPRPTTTATVQPALPPKVTTRKPAPAPSTPGVALSPPPSSWTTLSDDFSGPAPNATLWSTWADGAGSSYSLVNGHLELNIPSDAQTGGTYNMVGPAWGTQCRFDGDFDARVDFQLLDWQAAAGGHAQLSAWSVGGINSAVSRQVNQWGDQYVGNVNQQFNVATTTDAKGTVRLVRSNGVLSSYYLAAGGKWVLLEAANAPGRTMLGLQLFAMATEWLHVPIRMAFDNFSVSAPSMICP